jgi:hypothetical protein
MPRSNRETKDIINNIKAQIKKLNKDTGVGLSYRNVYSVFASIYNLGDEGRINKGILTYEKAIKKEIAANILSKRTLIWSNRIMAEKNEKDPIKKYSITQLSEDVRKLMDTCGELFREDYRETHKPNEADINSVYNWEMRELKKQSYFSAAKMSVTAWDRNCFRDESAYLNEVFRNAKGEIKYVFKNEYDERNSSEDLIAADAFHKAGLIKEELAKHSSVWKFFNFRYVAACNDYIANVEDNLSKIGFAEREHGAKAFETLKNTVAIPHDSDIKKVNAARDKKLEGIGKAQPAGNKAKAKDNGKNNVKQNNELMEITDEVRSFGNKMFEIEFRPSQANIFNEVKMMLALSNHLKDNPAFNEDQFGKNIFEANQEKIKIMLSVVRNNGAGSGLLQKKFEEIETRLWNDTTVGYEPRTIQEFEKAVENKKVNEANLGAKADEKKAEGEQNENDTGFNLCEVDAEIQNEVGQDNDNRIRLDASEFKLFDSDDSEKAPGVEENKEGNVAQRGV